MLEKNLTQKVFFSSWVVHGFIVKIRIIKVVVEYLLMFCFTF